MSNYTNYEPYERMKAVNGFIMWPNDTNYIHPADSDDNGAILGYVRHSFYILTPTSLYTLLLASLVISNPHL